MARYLGLLGALIAVVVGWGTVDVAVWRDGPGAPVPLYLVAPAGAAALVALSAHGPLDHAEVLSARPRWLIRLFHIGVGTLVSAAGLAGALAAAGAAAALSSVLRNLVFASALTLLCGRIAGWSAAWVAPPAVFIPLTWLGDAVDRPWAWPLHVDAHLTGWTTALVTAALGVVAGALTPWRRAAWRPRRAVRGDGAAAGPKARTGSP